MSDQLRDDIKTALDKERSRLIGIRGSIPKSMQSKREEVEQKIALIEEYNEILVNERPCFLTIKSPFDPARIRL